MRHVFLFFIKNYKLSFMLTAFIVIAGVMGILTLKSESFPSVDFATTRIVTIYPGSSAEEVEERVTKKVEDEIRTVDGIRDVKSISQPQRSEITVRIDIDNVDSQEVVNDLQRAIQRVTDLPKDILEPPKLEEVNTKELPVIEIALTGPNENRSRDKLAEELERQLEDVRGVSKIYMEGNTEREFQILLDPKKLDELHVGISEVFQAVNKRTQNIPAGYIRGKDTQTLVRVQGQVSDAQEMGGIIIRSNFSGQHIKVKDVAEVRDGHEDLTIKTRFNGEPATIIIALKNEQADIIQTVNGLENKISGFQKTLPPDFRLIVYNNEADRISDRLSNVVSNAVIGLVLVLIVLLIFMPGILGIMASLSLPLCLLGTLSMFPFLGINFNTITMLGLVIVIGMLVDNSIVISEDYERFRREGQNPLTAALNASHQFWIPITATVLATIAAFLPMMVTKGVMGEFIEHIPVVVSLGLGFSLLESFFLLPARLQFTITKPGFHTRKGDKKGRTFGWMRIHFQRFIQKCIRLRYLVLFALVALLGGSVLIAVYGNHFELFPAEDIELYFVRFEAPINTPLDKTEEIAEKLTHQVFHTLGKETVQSIVTKVGISFTGLNDPDARNGDNVGLMVLNIPIAVARTLKAQEVLKKLRSITVPELKSLTFEAAAGGPPIGKALQITLRSHTHPELRAMANEMLAYLRTIPGAVDISDDEVSGGTEYRLVPDHIKLSKLELDTETVGIALRTALQGAIASELNLESKDFNLRIRYSDTHKQTIQALENTKILQSSGQLIPMTSIATIQKVPEPAVRKHFDYLRSITIIGNVIPEQLSSVTLNAKARAFAQKLQEKYPGVSLRFGGEEENTRESMESLVYAMILALLGIFVILVFIYSSYLQPFLVLTSIPLGLIGVNLAFFFHQKPLSFLALIGVIGLAGVVVNSAIILISHINDLVKSGRTSPKHYLSEAAAHRLKAILSTSLTTVVGLVPTAYGFGGYDPILVPMTLALSWGLLSGTFLTLIWIPCGYVIMLDMTSFFSKLFRKKVV